MTTDAARHPERFEGLFDHWKRYAGEFRGAEPPTVHGYNRGYAIAFHQPPDAESVTAGTNGLRFQHLTMVLKEQELACTVRAGQEGAAHYLVDTVASRMLEQKRGLLLGDAIRNERRARGDLPAQRDRPAGRGTQVRGVTRH